jgi:TolB-like protein/DNA-binding winged helix-turn-helix (wHTH) protein/tetratricopeptide (TPR) repeat protein
LRYLFEDFALDSDARELRRGAAFVPTEPQVFDLLVFLISHRDRVVSKQDLIMSVWGGRIVSESALDTRINAVRRAIGDSGKEQRLIRTTIGKGIRFVGKVREQPEAQPVDTPTSTEPVAVATQQWRTTRPFVVTICLLLVMGGLGLWWAPSETAPKPAPARAAPIVAGAPAKPAPRLSIVVLPFSNLSNDPEQDYFVDAITDELTSDLSRIVNSFVIARTTAFAYKGRAVDVRQVGRELGVRYVLEGSVRRSGEQVQVNVQLIDSENGAHVWVDRFDTDRTNLTRAQDEITGRLARALELQLIEAVGRRIERDKPGNLDAGDRVMRGWAYYHRPQTTDNLRLALAAFEEALAVDPESIDARVGVARVLGELLATTRTTEPGERAEQLARADRLLGETLERDRNNAEAHADLGRTRRLQGRLIESQIELEKAIALDRNHELAIIQSGITSLLLGKPDLALPFFEKFLQINPQAQNVFFIYYWLGHTHLFLSEADEAVVLLRKGYSANPNFEATNFMLAGSLGLRGDLGEAKDNLDAFVKKRPNMSTFRLLSANWTNWNATPGFVAYREKTLDVGLRRAGMPEE